MFQLWLLALIRGLTQIWAPFILLFTVMSVMCLQEKIEIDEDWTDVERVVACHEAGRKGQPR
jgi:hypothetical protein